MVAASQGKTIRVLYVVIRGANPAMLSQPLDLPVSVLGQQHLPTPVVPQASGGTLDLTRFTGDASVTVKAWPLIAAGQRYWISVSGTLENGSEHSFYVAHNQAVGISQVGEGLNHSLLRAELERFKHDSMLTVVVLVTFDGSSDMANARRFPEFGLTLKTVPDISIIDFENLPAEDTYLPVGTQYDLKYATLKVFSYPAQVGRNIHPAPYFENKRLLMHSYNNALGHIEIHLKRPAERVRFGFAFTSEIIAYDVNGKEVYRNYFTNSGPRFVEFTRGEGGLISILQFKVQTLYKDGAAFDNMTLYY
ncbi:hypothetical protein D3C77_387840 [compost metagenome]